MLEVKDRWQASDTGGALDLTFARANARPGAVNVRSAPLAGAGAGRQTREGGD